MVQFLKENSVKYIFTAWQTHGPLWPFLPLTHYLSSEWFPIVFSPDPNPIEDRPHTGIIYNVGPIPGKDTVSTEWDVHWHLVTDDGQWGPEVGTSQFSPTFSFNWGSGPLFQGYDDHIGFWAYMKVNMQRDGSVTFTVGGDDYFWLDVDGVLTMSGASSAGISKTVSLSRGMHTLAFTYMEMEGNASAVFNCDADILTWDP
jgi:hypothetical protein